MYRCVDGQRALRGAEFDLVRGAIGLMMDSLVAEYRDDTEQKHYGINAFDQWDEDQRIWLLEQATQALLSDRPAPTSSAILEATVAAIFAELTEQLLAELEGDQAFGDQAHCTTVRSGSWRRSIWEAFCSQQKRKPPIGPDSIDGDRWLRVLGAIADQILGPTSYDRVESFRDGEIARTERFLASRGLPSDFLKKIPPIRTVTQIQASIDSIQGWLF